VVDQRTKRNVTIAVVVILFLLLLRGCPSQGPLLTEPALISPTFSHGLSALRNPPAVLMIGTTLEFAWTFTLNEFCTESPCLLDNPVPFSGGSLRIQTTVVFWEPTAEYEIQLAERTYLFPPSIHQDSSFRTIEGIPPGTYHLFF